MYHANFLFKDTSGTAFFECEKFADNALNRYTIKYMKTQLVNFLDLSTEPFVNRHESTKVDTIYTFSNATNKIQIYRARHEDFIFTFDVTDPKLKLAGGIGPGMTKGAFASVLHIDNSFTKNVHVTNKEGSMRFMFIFSGDTLKKVYSYLYLD